VPSIDTREPTSISADPLTTNGGAFNRSEFEQPATGVWKPERPAASSSPEQLEGLLAAGITEQEFREPANGVWNATLQLKVLIFVCCLKELSDES
jgi:hypothetical protein